MRRPARCAWLATLAALAAAVPAGAATRPDLAPSGVRVTGVTVEAGSCAAGGCRVRLTVAADVLNRGARGARRTRLGFFVSRDARRDGRDATAGQRWVQAIRGGGRRRAVVSLSVSGLAPGTYRAIACADLTRRERERRESNNCRASGPFGVQDAARAPGAGPGPAPPQPAAGCQEPGWRTDLCNEIAAAMANRAFFDMADAVTFALLYQHHRTGQAIAPSIAAASIEPHRTAWDPVRGQAGLATYRVAGFLDFWKFSTYAGVDWPRYPDALDTPAEFLSWWQTYAIVQNTARQNAINHHLNAMIGSELAWRNAMDDWKAYDMRLITAQQYSDATVFAHRTLEDARTAVANAENAVKSPR